MERSPRPCCDLMTMPNSLRSCQRITHAGKVAPHGDRARPPRRDRVEQGRAPHRHDGPSADRERPPARPSCCAARSRSGASRACCRARSSGRSRPVGLAGLGDSAETTEDLLRVGLRRVRGDHHRRRSASRGRTGTSGATAARAASRRPTSARRVDRVIASLGEGDVALFAHGHVLRVLAARWIGLGPEAGRPARARHRARSRCSATSARRAVVKRWNSPVPGAGPAAPRQRHRAGRTGPTMPASLRPLRKHTIARATPSSWIGMATQAWSSLHPASTSTASHTSIQNSRPSSAITSSEVVTTTASIDWRPFVRQ